MLIPEFNGSRGFDGDAAFSRFLLLFIGFRQNLVYSEDMVAVLVEAPPFSKPSVSATRPCPLIYIGARQTPACSDRTKSVLMKACVFPILLCLIIMFNGLTIQ